MNLKNLFRAAEAPVTVIFERSCFVAGERYEEGATHSFPPKIAAEVVASGAARDPEAESAAVAKADDLQSLLPPPVQPEALPDGWLALPKCFSQWWTLKEARRALSERADAIEEILMAWYQGRSPEFSRTLLTLPQEYSSRLFQSFNFEINTELPADIEKLRYLKDSYQRACELLTEQSRKNQPSFVKAQLECSQHTQDKHGELCRAIGELHGKGFDLFSLRISALGLHHSQIARLFQGSADYEKYHSIAAPSLQNLKLAWSTPGENPVHYLATPPTTMVQMLRRWEATLAEVETLAKQADRELTSAKKVSSKAA